MKNLMFLFLIFILLVVISIGKYCYSDQNITAFKELLTLNDKLSKQLIKDYFSENEALKKEAQTEIKKIVLKDLGYENWLDYIDYIEISIYPVDIYQAQLKDLIISLNITKDTGVIGIYKSTDDANYILSDKIENLVNIKDISFIKDVSTNRVFILVNEILDERFGAFIYDEFLRVFTKENDLYKEVFRQSIDYEAFFFEGWTEPSLQNPKWYKLIEKSSIHNSINNANKIIFDVSKKLAKYEADNTIDNSIPEKFELVEEKELEIKYVWSEKFKYYIQGKAKIKSTNEIVGIIEDSSQNVDSLLRISDTYYKIIDNNGKIRYIRSDNIIVL